MTEKTRLEVRAIRFDDALWRRIVAEAGRRSATGAGEVVRALVQERLDALEVAAAQRARDLTAADAIHAAFAAREAAFGGMVPIAQLRRAVNVPRLDFDRALFDLQRDDRLSLVKLNDARGKTDDELAEGIRSIFGYLLFFVSRGPRS